MSDLTVSNEFLEENKSNLGQFMPKSRKQGPYSKQEKEKRRNEVYRLHFDYGYSARKISDLMKVNRNTINGDISFWYHKVGNTQNIFDPEVTIIMNLRRFEEQRSRLREQIDKVSEFSEKLSLERMVFDIDSKILQIYQKLGESTRRIMDLSTNYLNKYMEDNKKPQRYMLYFDRISVSDKAKKKIEKIIKDDKSKGRTI
jgi:hypothetical protein